MKKFSGIDLRHDGIVNIIVDENSVERKSIFDEYIDIYLEKDMFGLSPIRAKIKLSKNRLYCFVNNEADKGCVFSFRISENFSLFKSHGVSYTDSKIYSADFCCCLSNDNPWVSIDVIFDPTYGIDDETKYDDMKLRRLSNTEFLYIKTPIIKDVFEYALSCFDRLSRLRDVEVFNE